jgi:calcineurin-like phosphoesterase family protein
MNKTWFTADTHLDHPFMAKQRRFTNVKTMDLHIIRAWNGRVAGGDVVYMLGDIYWGNNPDYIELVLRKLRGSKVLVKGNHDGWVKKVKYPFRRIHHKTFKLGFDNTHKATNKKHFVMCHYPLWSWNRKLHGAIHLHGHSHAMTWPQVNMLDVGIDSAKIILGDYVPFSMEEVLYLTDTTGDYGRY